MDKGAADMEVDENKDKKNKTLEEFEAEAFQLLQSRKHAPVMKRPCPKQSSQVFKWPGAREAQKKKYRRNQLLSSSGCIQENDLLGLCAVEATFMAAHLVPRRIFAENVWTDEMHAKSTCKKEANFHGSVCGDHGKANGIHWVCFTVKAAQASLQCWVAESCSSCPPNKREYVRASVKGFEGYAT